MEGCIIHNKDRIRLWPASTMMKKPLDIFFEYKPVSGTLKYLEKKAHPLVYKPREYDTFDPSRSE